MPNKRQILKTFPRSLLLEIARTFDFPGLTAKPKEEILAALMGKRSMPIEEILQTLKVSDLKNICREFLIITGSAGKNDLISILLSDSEKLSGGNRRRKNRSFLRYGFLAV